MTDEDFMQLAILQARAAGRRGEVPVGAIIVDPASGDIISRAANAPIAIDDPTAHAEVLALRDAAYRCGNYRLNGLTLYVTLEPCTMCAGAISNARISRVVFGASDVKGGAVENGVRFFEAQTCHHRPEVTGGVLAQDCAGLLKDFFKARRKK
ncbi:MAG: tRNA adenosine(34) deaminase TadA [Robiginitomaculum sp.]